MKTTRATQRKAFGVALAIARAAVGMTQTQLADQLEDYDQKTVSKWEKGVTEPPPEVASQIEEVVEVAPGTLTRKLGYLPLRESDTAVHVSVVDAILADELLDDAGRTALLGTYRALTGRRRRT